MRNYLTCELGTVYELTVADVRSFLSAMDDSLLREEEINKYIESNKDDILYRCSLLSNTKKPLIKLNDAEKETLFNLFMRVNKSYFKPVKTKQSLQLAEDALKALDTTIISLIEVGHHNIFGYGWSFFTHVIEHHGK